MRRSRSEDPTLGTAGSGVCENAWTPQLDSNAREAKERLDQKLRFSVVKRGCAALLKQSSESQGHVCDTRALCEVTIESTTRIHELLTEDMQGRRPLVVNVVFY